AMQALPLGECATVRTHLDECAQCRVEFASINGDLALVALSVDQQPLPPDARARFVAKLAFQAEPKADQAPLTPIALKPQRASIVWLPWLAAAALLVLSVSLGVQLQQLKE